MALLVKFGKFCRQTTINLTEIDAADYKLLNDLKMSSRKSIVAYIVRKFSDSEVQELVERLSIVCFEIAGPLFIRKGRTSFLADVIQAYVDKLDGERFARTCRTESHDSLRDFQFSPQSVKLFRVLADIASVQSREKDCDDYSLWLPQNISNKVWLPILLRRASSQSFLTPLSQKMQSLAQNTELLASIFTSNISREEVIVERLVT